MRRWRLVFVFGAVVLLFSFLPFAHTSACSSILQSCSGNYGVTQTHFGTGGNISCSTESSTHYCATTSAGDLGVGNSTNGVTSGKHQIEAGSGATTNRDPSLALTINSPSIANLGYLNTGNVTTDTATFSVQSYLAGGYVVQTIGNPPTDNGAGAHQLTPITTTNTGSIPGTEQFGMNLTSNTVPVPMGATPSCQVGGFCNLSTLSIASNYNNSGKYYYNNGDTIATSTSSSSQTNFTLSYIFNIAGTTPDGQYTLNQTFVVTSTF